MVFKDFLKKQENLIGTCLLLLVMMIFTAIRYDYYYDLNDDVLMKDILAGVYTGVPEGHNIQMLWPISVLISLCYRVGSGLPCYGLFLCACHYGSIGLIAHRSLTFCKKRTSKVLLLLTEGILFMGLFLQHLVSAQYTLTCTLLASAAAFLFVTTDIELSAKAFIKKNIGTVLLVVLAYLIRSEMLLLVTPLICVAGVIKWGSEKVIFTKEHALKYLTVIGVILAGLLLGQGCHRLAYGSEGWKTFTEYFDNRTELYDFQILPEYEPHQAFYESIGLTESERKLLSNYNFGLDEEIDEDILGEVAAYAAANRSAETPFFEKLTESLKGYYRRTVYGPSETESDYPYSYILLFSYLAVFVTAMLNQEEKPSARLWQIVWKLGLLGTMRSVLWVWLIFRGRVPLRISHSMYLMELCILAGILLMQINALQKKKILPLAVGVFYCLIGVVILPGAIAVTDADVASKAENNVRYNELYDYFSSKENQKNFYFIDVYSSVGYTEKMFEDVDNTLDNYDIMGGWACKSPLWKKKLAVYGIDNMETALVGRDDVFYVQEKEKDTSWLHQYYKDHGMTIQMELLEQPVEEFEIYKIAIKK